MFQFQKNFNIRRIGSYVFKNFEHSLKFSPSKTFIKNKFLKNTIVSLDQHKKYYISCIFDEINLKTQNNNGKSFNSLEYYRVYWVMETDFFLKKILSLPTRSVILLFQLTTSDSLYLYWTCLYSKCPEKIVLRIKVC